MHYSIGVDIGGTNTVFGVVDRDGNIVCESSINTQEYADVDDFVDASVRCIKSIIKSIGAYCSIDGAAALTSVSTHPSSNT